MTQVSYCPRNPKNETNLRCSRCEELICPACMVQTPVGARCPTCARATRIPTYNVPPVFMARGIAAGVVTALALGVAFIFVNNVLLLVPFLFPYLHIAVVAGIGYVVGEAVSLSVNRKKGRTLKFIGAGSMLVASFPISFAIISVFQQLPLLLLLGMGVAFWLSIRRF
ncbi:MAG: B-box zinc finger protein [Chloroflexi bacterium]|nr:B-box zinc finger protein [Chloroflexota bacterium]